MYIIGKDLERILLRYLTKEQIKEIEELAKDLCPTCGNKIEHGICWYCFDSTPYD